MCRNALILFKYRYKEDILTFTLLLQSIYRLKKACHGELDEECSLLTPDQVVDRIFELVDENGDGKTYYDSLYFHSY